jgi:hypothetical protein
MAGKTPPLRLRPCVAASVDTAAVALIVLLLLLALAVVTIGLRAVATEAAEVEAHRVTVVRVSRLALASGAMASTLPVAATHAWRRSSLATRRTRPSSTLASTLKSTTTFPSRPPVPEFLNLSSPSPIHPLTLSFSKISPTLVTPPRPRSKSTLSPSSPVAGT